MKSYVFITVAIASIFLAQNSYSECTEAEKDKARSDAAHVFNAIVGDEKCLKALQSNLKGAKMTSITTTSAGGGNRYSAVFERVEGETIVPAGTMTVRTLYTGLRLDGEPPKIGPALICEFSDPTQAPSQGKKSGNKHK